MLQHPSIQMIARDLEDDEEYRKNDEDDDEEPHIDHGHDETQDDDRTERRNEDRDDGMQGRHQPIRFGHHPCMQQLQIRLLEIRPVAGQEGLQQILSHPVHTDTEKGRDSSPEEDPSESKENPDQEKGHPNHKMPMRSPAGIFRSKRSWISHRF